MLAQHGAAAEDLAAVFFALASTQGLAGLDHAGDPRTIFVVVEVLEEVGLVVGKLKGLGHVAVLAEEQGWPLDGLGGGEVLGQRDDAGPMAGGVDETGLDGVVERVDEAAHEVDGALEADVAELVGREQVLAAPIHGVVVLGDLAVELAHELGDSGLGVVQAEVVVIAQHDAEEDLYTGLLRSPRKAVLEGTVRGFGRLEQELALRAPSGHEAVALREDVARPGHLARSGRPPPRFVAIKSTRVREFVTEGPRFE
jgi:hypothetical protein